MTLGGETFGGRATNVACARKDSRNDRLATWSDRLTMLDSTSFVTISFTNHAR